MERISLRQDASGYNQKFEIIEMPLQDGIFLLRRLSKKFTESWHPVRVVINGISRYESKAFRIYELSDNT